ncbi:MAG: type II toxin-antitoxin system Phd/YefM family antitoxin [Ruminiclostridium sp.]|nr:type II toxin-antitoxin system Phd/YefM family antitoxin [Ruminiclostridium sp.]
MNNVLPAIKDTISISQFNKGLAGKIFKEVNETGTKVVIKNNAPECVLMSPKEYTEIMENYEDALLYAESMRRLAHTKPELWITEDKVLTDLGITENDLADIEIGDGDIE